MEEDFMELNNYKTVQIWLKELRSRYNTDEINLRVELLTKFCDFVAKNPDELVNEVYNFETHKPKLKNRKLYNDKINEYLSGIVGSATARDNYGNILEGFFIYNGVKIFRKRKVWTHPGRISSK